MRVCNCILPTVHGNDICNKCPNAVDYDHFKIVISGSSLIDIERNCGLNSNSITDIKTTIYKCVVDRPQFVIEKSCKDAFALLEEIGVNSELASKYLEFLRTGNNLDYN